MRGPPDEADQAAGPAANGNAAPEAGARRWLVVGLATLLAVFVLVEVNVPLLPPLAELAVFAGLGLGLCFVGTGGGREGRWRQLVDGLLAVAAAVCCGYLVVESGSLGQRAAAYTPVDLAVGSVGILVVLEAARRSVGWSLPALAIVFLVYAHQGVARGLPDWLFPHRGQDWAAIVGQTWLRSEGVFGTALAVMFRYVFLFVLFGVALQAAGATGWVIAIAERLFGRRAGGPAKVAVLASGLTGSLSGSAVANAVTTGSFTIPLMRGIGFPASVAAGIEAAASSGGALVPPVMGAGAYMMLEIIDRDPPVRFLEIVRAAIIPAVLYYLSLFLLVHFYARRLDAGRAAAEAGGVEPKRAAAAEAAAGPPDEAGGRFPPVEPPTRRRASPRDGDPRPPADEPTHRPSGSERPAVLSLAGLAFVAALGTLLTLLVTGSSPFRAVSLALAVVVGVMLCNPKTAAAAARLAAGATWAGLAVAGRWLLPQLATWSDAVIAALAATLVIGLASRTWRARISGAMLTTAVGGVPLVAAAACVGIVIGLVSRTGIGTGVPAAIIPLAGDSLLLALLAIMGCSLVLGMGLPSAVSYLLLATIIGPVFTDPAIGVPILAAHLFIFYFGMMAMVTPPVALAAYATASIAGAAVMPSSLAAFRFALAGFTLPFMFVYRPALLLMGPDGGPPAVPAVLGAVAAAVVGIVALAAGLAGFLRGPLSWQGRAACCLAAACALVPDRFGIAGTGLSLVDLAGLAILVAVAAVDRPRAG